LPRAAVLVPVILRPEPTLLFTRRSANLPRHPGQVSFPGGRAEASDGSAAVTALREMAEETGVSDDFVTLLGFLGASGAATGYAILPVVGAVREGFVLNPCPAEVAEVFEVPLRFFLDSANRRQESVEWQGARRNYYAYHYAGQRIWGTTAGIVSDLAERLR
jgi:8-oxo-dGTP pyrophosphatase MutT (NUDIX family)